MNRRHAPLLLSLMILTGCQSTPVGLAAAAKTTRHTAAVASNVHMLQSPAGAVRLQGTVQLDASYLVARAGGKLLNGTNGRVASAEGGKLSGTSLIGQDGASVIAQGAGNVIVDAATVVSNDGGSVVSNDGGSLIGQDGGSIIAQGGGNAVTGHTAGLKLLASDDTPAIGEQMPAAGMVVQVRTLRDDKRVAIGVDAQGHPAYALYTNLDGKFELYLPRTLAQNVRIIATPRTKSDPKLRYAVIGMGNQAAKIDEDTSQSAQYLLTSIAGRVKQLMTHTPQEVAALAPVFGNLDALIATAGVTGKLKDLAPAAQDALALQVTKLLLESIDLNQAQFDDGGVKTGCLEAIAQIMAVTRSNMGTRMAAIEATGEHADAYFARQSYMKEASALGFKLEKPSDFMTLVVLTQLNHLEENELVRFQRIHDTVIAFGLPTDDKRMLRFAAASGGLLTSMGTSLSKSPTVTQAALALLRSGGH